MPIYLTNKDARPFSEGRIFFDQQGILNLFKYFTYGDSINDQFIVPMFRDLTSPAKTSTQTRRSVSPIFLGV
jgi:hypothetical protein